MKALFISSLLGLGVLTPTCALPTLNSCRYLLPLKTIIHKKYFLTCSIEPYTTAQVYQTNWYIIAEHPYTMKRVLADKRKSHSYETIIDSRRLTRIAAAMKRAKPVDKKVYDVRLVGLFKGDAQVDTLMIDVVGHCQFGNKNFLLGRRLAKLLSIQYYPINPKAQLNCR